MRKGWFSDAYFGNTVMVLDALASEPGYMFTGNSDIPVGEINNGNVIIEMQFFTRRKPFSVVAGVDEALAILEECTGYFDKDGKFVNTYNQLEVDAVHDGTFSYYSGNPLEVQPVLRVRGRYRDFAVLETTILGVLTEATRVATNVYNVMVATRGKDVLFFPARFAHYKLQALHGYAYFLAVQAYNHKFNKNSRASVSTDTQGGWWGSRGGGTMAHASIACFFGDTVETTLQFARNLPIDVKRIALVDFHNDCIGETLKVMQVMWDKYWEIFKTGNKEEAEKYRLFGVRPDTAGNMRDISLPPLGDKKLDCGVNPRLVWALREAIDKAWKDWALNLHAQEAAKRWCKDVKIVATGGFNVQRINEFEDLGVPVDIYGVGSSLLENSNTSGTNNDFTADIVRVKIDGEWKELCKIGRQACNNPDLEQFQS
nr:nicotinate phosphoribosyltransferase [Phosphitispora fastidiosa]